MKEFYQMREEFHPHKTLMARLPTAAEPDIKQKRGKTQQM